MPPSSPPSSPQRPIEPGSLLRPPEMEADHMLPPRRKHSAAGPVIGIVIILLLLGFGALYFWGASMNRKSAPLPLIPGDGFAQPL